MEVKNLTENKRKQIFVAVVELQDGGASPADARKEIAKRFKVSLEQVRDIEDEGVTKTWPPLEECDD